MQHDRVCGGLTLVAVPALKIHTLIGENVDGINVAELLILHLHLLVHICLEMFQCEEFLISWLGRYVNVYCVILLCYFWMSLSTTFHYSGQMKWVHSLLRLCCVFVALMYFRKFSVFGFIAFFVSFFHVFFSIPFKLNMN